MFYEVVKTCIQMLTQILFVLDCIQFGLVNVVLSIYYCAKMVIPLKKKDIRGQLALVTGGGNGLGRSISLALAEKGCNIIILDVDLKAAEQTASNIRKIYDVNVVVFMVDVSNFNEVQNIRKLIEKDIGEVDILVNNAGIIPKISLLEGTPNEIEQIIQVNFIANFWTIREFIIAMNKKNAGHIVAISSLSAYDALGRQLAYSSTKYALRGLMEGLQEELRIDKSNIVATSIFPGFINTRPDLVNYMNTSLRNPDSLEYLSPENVAASVIDAIIYNKLNVSVPSYYLLLVNILKLLPKEIQNRCRDKYKPILHKNSNIQIEQVKCE